MAGTVAADVLMDGAGNSTAMDNAIYGSAKAWVNFNASSGSAVIRASYNISSVTVNTTGGFTINFTNALADANYSAIAQTGGGYYFTALFSTYNGISNAPTSSGFQIGTANSAASVNLNPTYVCVSVFR